MAHRPPLLRLLAAAGFALLIGLPLAAQNAAAERDLNAIVEEQALLTRQLERLKSTMEVLLQRIEAEGRTRTADLLREGLTLLQRRAGPAGSPLPEERMQEAREALESGKLAQSLETQRALIDDLERLVSILLDRKNLEGLDEKIENLAQLQKELGLLADQERGLREKTAELRTLAGGEAQRALEERLAALEARQRKLLEQTERLGREAGTLEIEQLEKELEALLAAQRTDRGVLEGWNPADSRKLGGARESVERARRAEAQAARLDEAEKRLFTAAAELEAGTKSPSEQAAALRAAAENARRHANVSKDPAAESSAAALAAAERALTDEDGAPRPAGEAAAEMRAGAERLAAEARERRAEATSAGAKALEELARSRTKSSDEATTQAADEAQRALERAQAEGARPESTQEATEQAAETLAKAQAELEFLGQALAGSQAAQARKSEALRRGLESLPQAKDQDRAGSKAVATKGAEALARAAEAMRAASQAARAPDQAGALAQARVGEDALEEARAALAQARAAAARSSQAAARELAGAQAETAQATGELAEQASESALARESEQAAEQSLQQAQSAMEAAGKELGEGKSASAANEQRKAIQALQQAAKAAREGVRLDSEEERKQAEELAAEQERVRQEILDLARRIKERQDPRSRPDLTRAESEARKAQSSLQQGDPAGAEEQEAEVERELRQAKSELSEEEEQYQRLRAEEQLFRTAEEIVALLEAHRVQMKELGEVDAERKGADEPSRAQKMRLRRIAREEGLLGTRAEELAGAIEAEGTQVAAGLLRNAASDLARLSRDLAEEGSYQTGSRVQGLQRDVEDSLLWLLDALRAEQSRRQSEGQQGGQQQDGRPPLIPDTAELKLLLRMELDLGEALDALHADQASSESSAPDPALLRDLARLAGRHERLTKYFRDLGKRVGIPPLESAEE